MAEQVEREAEKSWKLADIERVLTTLEESLKARTSAQIKALAVHRPGRPLPAPPEKQAKREAQQLGKEAHSEQTPAKLARHTENRAKIGVSGSKFAGLEEMLQEMIERKTELRKQAHSELAELELHDADRAKRKVQEKNSKDAENTRVRRPLPQKPAKVQIEAGSSPTNLPSRSELKGAGSTEAHSDLYESPHSALAGRLEELFPDKEFNKVDNDLREFFNPRGPRGVSEFEHTLTGLYFASSDAMERRSKNIVQMIVYFKETNGLQQESIVVKIRNHNNNGFTNLKLERTLDTSRSLLLVP